MYKVVVSDLDGTLLNNQHVVSDFTRSTLDILVKDGVRLIIASGRHIIDMRGIRQAIGIDCDLIAFNGAIIVDSKDHALFQHSLPPELAEDIICNIQYRHPDCDINVDTSDGWYIQRETPEWLEFHKESGFSYSVTELSRLNMENVYKIYFRGRHESLQNLEHDLLEYHADKANTVFSRLDTLEVMAMNVNKGVAVKETLEAAGLTLEDAVAFGDGMNDFELLSMAGKSFVMDNATDDLKNALPKHLRAESCDKDGVARKLIDLFGL